MKPKRMDDNRYEFRLLLTDEEMEMLWGHNKHGHTESKEFRQLIDYVARSVAGQMREDGYWECPDCSRLYTDEETECPECEVNPPAPEPRKPVYNVFYSRRLKHSYVSEEEGPYQDWKVSRHPGMNCVGEYDTREEAEGHHERLKASYLISRS